MLSRLTHQLRQSRAAESVRVLNGRFKVLYALGTHGSSSSAGSSGKSSPSGSSSATTDEYLVFPTKFPLFPYYIYKTRISKHLYDYITNNNIRFVCAFPIKPGVSKSKYLPYSVENLEKHLHLKPTPPSSSKRSLSSAATSNETGIEISNNNLILDEPYSSKNEAPVYYVDHIDKIFHIGSVCRIAASIQLNGDYVAHLRSQIRIKIDPENYKETNPIVHPDQEIERLKNSEKFIQPIVYLSGKNVKNENLINVEEDLGRLMKLYEKLQKISKLNLPEVSNASATKIIELLSGYLCTLQYFSEHQLFQLFQITNLPERIRLLLKYYEEYISTFEKQWESFNSQNESKVDEEKHKETIRNVYEHMQQLMGQTGDQKYINKVKAKLAAGNYPEHVRKAIECELQSIEEGSPQANRKKHYIDLLVNYPFGVRAKESFEIKKAREILDTEHYGMKKIKQRILEFIAVSKLKGEFKSKVILLHGPPGVGKTSIVKSIAKCLNRPYGRISLGGESDTSIMKGHRKTYVGAYPGRIFDTIYQSKAENPVILLDEINKIQPRGGGASLQDVVMEILDPVQNNKFKDDYVDLEIDLSNVLFICTANSLDTIFPPLLDRMERIEVSGYTTHEKEEIFKKYIVKQSIEEAGIPEETAKTIEFDEGAANAMIEGYCKEAGVRNLVRKTNNIFHKMALKIVKNEAFNHIIRKEDLQGYLGLPKFFEARLFDSKPPSGVMIGLAYNAYGGSIMYIESVVTSGQREDTDVSIKSVDDQSDPKKPSASEPPSSSLIVTGNIHDVMKESCQLAFTYAKYITSTFFDSHFLEQNDVHLNFPEIQIGKDGPSAGIAITSTLISLALNKPMKEQIGMTGQITLSGKVGAIGGVKEKTMGAKREGVKNLIFPFDNKRDVEELQDEIKQGMNFHFAENYFQVLELVFGLKVGIEQQSVC